MPPLVSPPYRLAGSPVFDVPGLDRSAALRTDPDALEAMRREPGAVAVVVRDGRGLVRDDGSALVPLAAAPSGAAYLLGVAADGPVFVVHADEPLPESRSATLRAASGRLADADVGLLMQGVALCNWHESHPCCSRCGSPTMVEHAGWARRCPVDASEHHPRTDPAVIVLVLDGASPGADRCLLGRHKSWPAGRYSTLAGFVEPGETVEQAVAREIAEEVGVAVGAVSYAGSQPWPFPASLMLAFYAEAAAEHTDDAAVRVDGEEIADARWFDRATVAEQTETGQLLVPPRLSVARRLIEGWFGAPISTAGTWRR